MNDSALLRHPLANLEQCLYEWCLDAPDKAGPKRTALDVTICCVPLLGWIVGLWTSDQLALMLDATSMGDPFVVLAVCVVYRGCAIPVAWTILPAGKQRAWRREWLRMPRVLRPAIPRLNRAGAGRRRRGRPLAVPPRCPSGPAHISAHQSRAASSARSVRPGSCGSATWCARTAKAGVEPGRPSPHRDAGFL